MLRSEYYKEIEEMISKKFMYFGMRVLIKGIHSRTHPANYGSLCHFKAIGIIELLDKKDWDSFDGKKDIFAELPLKDFLNYGGLCSELFTNNI